MVVSMEEATLFGSIRARVGRVIESVYFPSKAKARTEKRTDCGESDFSQLIVVSQVCRKLWSSSLKNRKFIIDPSWILQKKLKKKDRESCPQSKYCPYSTYTYSLV